MLNSKWRSAAQTDIGTVRKINEDALLDASSVGMWCVADGMGGHQKGDVASQMIIEHLQRLANSQEYPLDIELIKQQLILVNRNLQELANELPESTVIGSTVVVLLFEHQKVHCIWAGDSRIYRLRDKQLTRLTRDHSQVEELVEAGLLSAAEAETHPAANVITRAVGAHEELNLDVVTAPLLPGDSFLLCSDGLNKVMSDSEITQFLISNSLDTLPSLLIQTAIARRARDNVSVVIVDYQSQKSEGGKNNPDFSMDDTLPLMR
ncbi:PP2C family protein-serine/threonine phosphatase [Neptunicella marina]|uniref:Serine/threonine-protein phosphatase n=1 Tax=Neptunicella marina TaxID=2125989 RepID=A0A8J6IU09_9ALTE|nr:protein phosphatase 2C domain-containing protein [Neptunicella marina]MBC3766666.1 serine/threonine-protein phosphatase [Neptunicella marina]